MKPTTISKGQLLISEPFLSDKDFKRSVVLLCEHSKANGSFGLVINRQLDLKLYNFIPDLQGFESCLYYGGPVEQETLHYLHTYGELLEGSIKVTDGIYRGGDFDQLKTYINTHIISPQNIRFYIGYSGWESDQLDNELQEKSWIQTPAAPKYIFSKDPQKLWRTALRDIGTDDYRIMSHLPEYPSLN